MRREQEALVPTLGLGPARAPLVWDVLNKQVFAALVDRPKGLAHARRPVLDLQDERPRLDQ